MAKIRGGDPYGPPHLVVNAQNAIKNVQRASEGRERGKNDNLL